MLGIATPPVAHLRWSALLFLCPMQVRTYYYEIKSVGSPKPEASSGLQIEDITRAQTGRLQAYKLFLIQVCAVHAC